MAVPITQLLEQRLLTPTINLIKTRGGNPLVLLAAALLAAATSEFWRRERAHDSPDARLLLTRYDGGLRDGSSVLVADRAGVRSTLRRSSLLPLADDSPPADVSVYLCRVRVPPWMSSKCLYETPKSCCPFAVSSRVSR